MEMEKISGSFPSVNCNLEFMWKPKPDHTLSYFTPILQFLADIGMEVLESKTKSYFSMEYSNWF